MSDVHAVHNVYMYRINGYLCVSLCLRMPVQRDRYMHWEYMFLHHTFYFIIDIYQCQHSDLVLGGFENIVDINVVRTLKNTFDCIQSQVLDYYLLQILLPKPIKMGK